MKAQLTLTQSTEWRDRCVAVFRAVVAGRYLVCVDSTDPYTRAWLVGTLCVDSTDPFARKPVCRFN